MNTIFNHKLNGWINFRDNQLMRCPKLKKIEGSLLLNIPYGSSFLDVGAHFGDTVLTMAMLAKRKRRLDIRFFAFEPNEFKCNHIRRIAKLNRLNVVVFCNCVGDESGNARLDNFTRNKNNVLTGAASFQKDSNGGSVIITLDDVKEQIEPVGFMHIDTEGWEVMVLKGATQILNNLNNKITLVAECWENSIAIKQVKNNRSPGIISLTPENDILEEVGKYDNIKLGSLFEEENNLIFKINYSNK